MPPSSTFAPDVMPSIKCSLVADCVNITGSVCHNALSCICPSTIPVYISEVSSCLTGTMLNTSCLYDEQCLFREPEYGRCGSNKICGCVKDYEVKMHPNVGINCVKNYGSAGGVDPAMIGVLVGLALMFVIICVVLRLFAKARFRETRSIFNTPNPRLMNASLFKDSKLLSPSRGDRRGSRASVRPPSRTASLASVTAGPGKSPNGSLATKGRRGSTISTASAHIGTTGGHTARNDSLATHNPKGVGSPSKDQTDKSSVAIETVD